jgi:hypothetical protein
VSRVCALLARLRRWLGFYTRAEIRALATHRPSPAEMAAACVGYIVTHDRFLCLKRRGDQFSLHLRSVLPTSDLGMRGGLELFARAACVLRDDRVDELTLALEEPKQTRASS